MLCNIRCMLRWINDIYSESAATNNGYHGELDARENRQTADSFPFFFTQYVKGIEYNLHMSVWSLTQQAALVL
jgi:hypothetical protein